MIDRQTARRGAAYALALALVLGGFAVLLPAVPAQAEEVDLGGAATLSVTALAPYTFSPNAIQNVAVGTNVTVTFTDVDDVAHTFTIYGRQGVVITNPSAIEPTTLDQIVYGSGYAPVANLNSTGSGQSLSATIRVNQSGWYEFMCMEAGHFQQGMYGFIAFGENLPANLSVTVPDTGPGAAVFIIVGTIVSLVVIAIVLGFVVGRRRGSEFEMPPQRLGYVEPPTAHPEAPTDGAPPLPDGPPKP
jgi:plastocyanin